MSMFDYDARPVTGRRGSGHGRGPGPVGIRPGDRRSGVGRPAGRRHCAIPGDLAEDPP